MRRVRIAVAATAAVLAGAMGAAGTVVASPPSEATGTFTQTSLLGPPDVTFAGPNLILEQTVAGSVSGTLSGDYVERLRVVIHPNGTFTAKGTGRCACTVDGTSGVVEYVVTDGGQEIDGEPMFAGRAVINGGSGDLAGVRGVLQIEGAVGPTGLSTIQYEGRIHSHP